MNRKANTYVSPSGNTNATLAIVGNQPEFYDVRTGKIFSGYIGISLDECLQMAKIPRHSIYLTNVIKDLDKPLSCYIDYNGKSNNWAISEDGFNYINELKEELLSLPNLNCVFALGNIALVALCSRIGISKWRGSLLESTLIPGLKVVPTFHVSSFTRPKFSFLNKPLVVNDLLKANKEAETKSINITQRNVLIRPTFDEAIATLNHCYNLGIAGTIIDIDIEVINEELDCISFSWEPTNAISIPFRHYKGDYFTPEQEIAIMKLIAKIIEDKRIHISGASFIFDCQFLFKKYGILPRGSIYCTQIAQKITYPDYPAGLDFVTSLHTDIPYYKDDGKQWIKMGAGGWEEWWNYNGMDSISTNAARPSQLIELAKQQNEATYERQSRLIKPLLYMAERGIKVDVEGMRLYKIEQEKELELKYEELNQEVGFTLNSNSPKQVKDYFYGTLGIKPYKKRNAKGDNAISTDVDAMKRLARRGYKAAQIILDIRRLRKRISTYLSLDKVDEDGRYKSSYKPITDTGRIASGTTIFGKGGNQQNWPHDLLRFLVFDEGYLGYSIDLSQIENRFVAYFGNIVKHIQIFESGRDMHRLTASIIYNKPYDEVSDEEGSSGIGSFSERDFGKKGNHSINYDTSYKTFALKNEIQESLAKKILNSIHSGYPEIRGSYQEMIKQMLHKNRCIENPFGRRRIFLGPIIPSNNVPISVCKDTYRKAFAHLPQSTTADKINEQGLNYIYYNQDLFPEVELLTQIHDSIVFQLPLSIPFIRHAEIILKIKKSLETPVIWKGREIPTPADLTIGLNMYKKESVELKSAKIPGDKETLSKKLEEIYASYSK